jgi:hypothetical protein
MPENDYNEYQEHKEPRRKFVPICECGERQGEVQCCDCKNWYCESCADEDGTELVGGKYKCQACVDAQIENHEIEQRIRDNGGYEE